MTQRNYKEKNVQEMNMEDLINTVSDDLKSYDKLKTLEDGKKMAELMKGASQDE